MTEEYKNFITPEKVMLLLPNQLPEKYISSISDQPLSSIYIDILELIAERKHKVVNGIADNKIFDLET